MIKSIWIEIRPALRSCHVSVVLEKSISSKILIRVKKSSLILEIKKKKFKIDFPEFVVEPLSMTNMNFANHVLNFRIQVECTFKFQCLSTPQLKPPIVSKEKSSLLCFCQNPLTTEVLFNRVLPLPSNEFNFSDMFCHLHGEELHLSSPKPELNDCLYSDDFIVINNELLKGCFQKGKFLKCNRCRTTVGISDKDSVKFWISSISLLFNNFTIKEHFKHLVWKAASDPFSLFPKILLECEEIESYLYIEVVDKHLVISNCQENLKLKNQQVLKLKYKFYASHDSDIKKLKSDSFYSFHHHYIHKPMMDFVVEFLLNMSKTIPSVFSVADNECMAYLNLSSD